MAGLPSGTRLGPYELLSLIHEGGVGDVYKASDAAQDRIVAIKILPVECADDRPLRDRIERDARAVAGLSHPNICLVHDVGQDVPVAPTPEVVSGFSRTVESPPEGGHYRDTLEIAASSLKK